MPRTVGRAAPQPPNLRAVCDRDDNPIADEIYDRVVAALGQLIAEVDVRLDLALHQLLATIAPPARRYLRPPADPV